MKLAETLGYLFYFKHDYVLNIFSKSKLDFSSTKSVFTNGIYRLAKKDCVPVLKGFFSNYLKIWGLSNILKSKGSIGRYDIASQEVIPF